jgi:hypothetical protein
VALSWPAANETATRKINTVNRAAFTVRWAILMIDHPPVQLFRLSRNELENRPGTSYAEHARIVYVTSNATWDGQLKCCRNQPTLVKL